MPKIKMTVREVIFHERKLEVTEQELKALRAKTGQLLDDTIGDHMFGRASYKDGYWEDGEIELLKEAH